MQVPPHVIAASLAAFELHDPQVPMARLVSDTGADLDRAGTQGDRHLVFADADVQVAISLQRGPSGQLVRVDVSGQSYDELTLVQLGGTRVVVDVNEGIAVLNDVQPGASSVVLRRRSGDRGAVRTAPIML